MVPTPVNSLGSVMLACAGATAGCATALASTPHVLLLGSALLVIGAFGYFCRVRFLQRCQEAQNAGDQMIAWSRRARKDQLMDPEEAKKDDLVLWVSFPMVCLCLRECCLLLESWLDLWGIFLNKINFWAAGTGLERAVMTSSSWGGAIVPWALSAGTVFSTIVIAFSGGSCMNLLVESKVDPHSKNTLGWGMAAAAGCVLTVLIASQPRLLGMALYSLAAFGHIGMSCLTYGNEWANFWGANACTRPKEGDEGKKLSLNQARSIAMALAKLAVGCGLLYAACTWAPIMAILSKGQVLAVATQWAQHPAVGIGCALLGAAAFGACTAVVEGQPTAEASVA